jgi:hypothetical protein
MLFFSFLLSICYGGIWIGLGLLVKNHLETVLSMILRKPIPDNLINPEDFQKTKSVINVIGILLILIGIGTMIIGLSSMIVSYSMPSPNFNFKF